MYRTYIRTFDGQVSDKTNTPNQQAALDAFAELVNRVELDGQKLAAALTYNNRQLAFHRFDRQPDDADYWRDKLDQIELPQAGRPAELDGGRNRNVYMSASTHLLASAAGNGNVSEGIRVIADFYRTHQKT